MEGIKHQRSALYVVNNTMVYENRRTSSCSSAWRTAPADFNAVIRNNLCIGNIPLPTARRADAAGNLLLKTPAAAGLVDAGAVRFPPQAGSPCIGKGVAAGKVNEIDLTPKYQYVHPCQREPRPAGERLDIGAFQL